MFTLKENEKRFITFKKDIDDLVEKVKNEKKGIELLNSQNDYRYIGGKLHKELGEIKNIGENAFIFDKEKLKEFLELMDDCDNTIIASISTIIEMVHETLEELNANYANGKGKIEFADDRGFYLRVPEPTSDIIENINDFKINIDKSGRYWFEVVKKEK